MIINIPFNYISVFAFRDEEEQINLLHEESRLTDMLDKEQAKFFESFMLNYNLWVNTLTERSFIAGAVSGARAVRQAAPDDDTIRFKYK